jgi:ribosome-binding factor A
MKHFSRSDRVSGQIQKNLSELIKRKIKDPRLEMVTITSVKMSQDLRIARIYFVSSSRETSCEQTIQGFKSASGYIKRTLASKLGLRYMPDLQFYHDESFDYGTHIDNLLKTLKTNETDNTTLEKQ